MNGIFRKALECCICIIKKNNKSLRNANWNAFNACLKLHIDRKESKGSIIVS